MNRRDFLEKTILGAAALAAAPHGLFAAPPPGMESAQIRRFFEGNVCAPHRATFRAVPFHAPKASELRISRFQIDGVSQTGFPYRVPPGERFELFVTNSGDEPRIFHVFTEWCLEKESE